MSRDRLIDASDDLVEYDDGRSYDAKAVKKITQQWLDNNMKDREAQFTESVSVKIFCGTWNVNAKKQEGGLTDWLLPKETMRDQGPADVYAVGFQEMVDLNAMNVAIDGGKSQQRSQFWQASICECLQAVGQYTVVAEKHLVGLLLVVLVKSNLVQHVKDVRTSSLGVGIMGMLGNKGGVAVRLCLYDSSLCFVCAHLAAHRENVAGRNADFKSIYERTVFPTENPGATAESEGSLVVRPRYGAARFLDVDVLIPDHEVVYWIGDLNYRITEDVPTEDVFYRIDTKDLAFLRPFDQLNVERARGAVFAGFYEGLLTFPPTYKFQPGTDLYERRAEKKLRAPAWCDRVLWKAARPEAVKLLNYRSSTLRPSDHKPVSALLETQLRIVVGQREREVYSNLMNTLEYWNNNETPVAEVTGYPVDLTNVKFNFRQSSTIQIRNKGKTYLHWHFICKLGDNRLSKSWVSVSCKSGLLFPEQTLDIDISVLVDKETAQALNQAKECLSDILVLRIENFNDFYINVSCAFDRSCFGAHLEELVTLQGPIRNTVLPATGPLTAGMAEVASSVSTSAPAATNSLHVPKELWRLIDALWAGRALREKDLFEFDTADGGTIGSGSGSGSGSDSSRAVGAANGPSKGSDSLEMLAIREALDNNTEFLAPCLPQNIARAIVELLGSFVRPVIPSELIPNMEIDASTMKTAARRLLESLPGVNYNVLMYVLSFFREVLKEGDFNRSTSAKMVDICVTSFVSSSGDKHISDGERAGRTVREGVMRPLFLHLLTCESL